MVNESGILYTIEGVAAGVLVITTAYLVVSTTMVFTPGDTHIIDMQLEQLGNDALAMMDTPDNATAISNLSAIVENKDGKGRDYFKENFFNCCLSKLF